MRARAAVYGCAVLALAAGCTSHPHSEPDLSPVPSTGIYASPKHTGTPVVTLPAEACHGGMPFSTLSPRYTGAGPHRMIGFQLDDYDRHKYISPDPPALPDAWASQRGNVPRVFPPLPQESDYRRAELALCMSGPRVTGRKVGTCSYTGEYGDETFELVAAHYDFKLFEARTGRLLKSFRINGEGSESCPLEVQLSRAKIAQGFSPDTVADHVRRFVEGRAAS